MIKSLRLLLLLAVLSGVTYLSAVPEGAVYIGRVDGTINPAVDDYLKTSLERAHRERGRLFVLTINTPGGLLPSTQSIVQTLLNSPIPTVVYVSPSGASATSAGVFITLAGHIAAMSPGTTIGAAHPVSSDGQSVQGDMRVKLEEFATSLVRAIAEQRGRNIHWAEEAVKRSVSITDREAIGEKVVDINAADLGALLKELEDRTVTVNGLPVTLKGLFDAPRIEIEMSFKQKVINILSDPTIAMLLGFGALLGLGIELYHPGLFLPGIVGCICLILSLTAAQVLPINYGGVALVLLGAVFFIVELFAPTFGLWGVAGIVCFVLGAIYSIDSDEVWGPIAVDKLFVGTTAGVVGMLLIGACSMAVASRRSKVTTGEEGLIGMVGVAREQFAFANNRYAGRISVRGELWRATSQQEIREGMEVVVQRMGEGLSLEVVPKP